MKLTRLFVAILGVSVAFGFALAVMHGASAKAEIWHPTCNYDCAYTWCDSTGCVSGGPGSGWQYYAIYSRWDDTFCEGPFDCGLEATQCSGPCYSGPPPGIDTL
jgi:hypothetical protein